MAARIKPSGQTQRERDAIALGRIESYMDGLAEGVMTCPTCKETREFNDKEISPTAAQLIRARYDKLRPSLSAVEQTIIDDKDSKSEQDILNQLNDLVSAYPGILDLLIAAKAKASQEQTTH